MYMVHLLRFTLSVPFLMYLSSKEEWQHVIFWLETELTTDGLIGLLGKCKVTVRTNSRHASALLDTGSTVSKSLLSQYLADH